MSRNRRRDPYMDFVDHPRFGWSPLLTGLDPESSKEQTFFHWHSPEERRIHGTAIAADLTRQQPATVPVTHYFDVTRECIDCERPFIFFAQEQQFWYEELGFPLESDCVRCVDCRKKQQGLALAKERYETLFHVENKTTEQRLEMAAYCLELMEAGVFSTRQTERVREWLNLVRRMKDQAHQARVDELQARVESVEARDG